MQRISKVALYTNDFTPDWRWAADDKTLLLFDLSAGQKSQVRDLSTYGRHAINHGAQSVSLPASMPAAAGKEK